MKNIVQNYGADLNWIESFAKNFEGKISGNFMEVPDKIYTGNKYFLNCGEGIVALYIEGTYHIDFRLIHKNLTDDFVGIYFDLSEGDVKLTYEEVSNSIGPWSNNLFVIDSSLEYQYEVLSGSKSFVLAIFIKKELVKKYFKKNIAFDNKMDDLFNLSTNTLFIKDRMSNDSFHLLSQLRKNEVGGQVFDFNLIATVYLLLSEYLIKVSNNKDEGVSRLVAESDLSGIIEAQQFLIENIENLYPGNNLIAQKVNMSESKFKTLFKKVTGISPNAFFIENKLILAKELLETKESSVINVSRQFGFVNNSYFASQFKKKFGLNPKQFVKQL